MEDLTTGKIILLVIVVLNLILAIINVMTSDSSNKRIAWVNAICGWTVAALEILNH